MTKKTWLITGISSGLGKALAQSVMETGDFVIGTLRKQSQVEAFNKEHKKNGFAIQLDITNEDEIDKTIETITARFGACDVLVNNAGVGFVGAIEETSMEEVRTIFESNFFGTLKMTQAILPGMRMAKKGHIIQISSQGGIKASAGFGIYNASKFALEGFTEALAQEVVPLGIQVTLVEPGPFRTKFANNGLKEAKKSIEDYSETAGTFRTKLKSIDGKQEGDPVKAAKAIIDLVNSKNPTLRLPLGKAALFSIEIKLESVKADLESNRKIAENAVFE